MTKVRTEVISSQSPPSPPPPPSPRCPLPHARWRKNSARSPPRQRTAAHRPARPARRDCRRGRAARGNRSRARTGRAPSAIPPAVLACGGNPSRAGLRSRRSPPPPARRRRRLPAACAKLPPKKPSMQGLPERAQVKAAHRGAHGGAAQIAVLRQRFRLVQRQHHLVGKAERQAARGVDFCRQRGVKTNRLIRRSGWSAR